MIALSATDTVAVGDTDRPSVTIVVLTWENYEDTAECLESLQSVEYPNYDVIVVDNGSTDGSPERLHSEFGWCEFIFNEENVGFASGNNPGIEHALADGADYVLLLNNDTVVPSDFLTPLVETAESYNDVAAVGGVQYRYDTGDILNAGARFFTYLGGRVTTHQDVRSEDPYEVSYVPSSLLLIDREFIKQNDILNERYFLGMEDVDLAVQARQSGKRVLITPESTIRHKEGLTRDRSPFMVYHWVRNRLNFAASRLPIHERVLFYAMFLATLLQFATVWLFRERRDLLESTVLGIRDYFSDAEFRAYEEFQ